MKVGDMVIMPGSRRMTRGDVFGSAVGLVVALPFVGPNGEGQQAPRMGIMWADGEGIDWEPEAWLKVINADR